MEPPHHTFAKRHSISSKDRAETQKEQPENNVKATSNVNHLMLNGRSSLSLSSQRVFHSLTGREEPAREQLMHSVFLATGLFMDADEHIDEIPVRHKASTKSAFRWFIDVCMAGSGKVQYSCYNMNVIPLFSFILFNKTSMCLTRCFPQVCLSMHTS
jgi:hypothetical protein